MQTQAEIPRVIRWSLGGRVEFCPNCRQPLSFSEGKPFCRKCQERVAYLMKASRDMARRTRGLA